jgi:predicted Fe-Mo cluster-binding NifX family protein
MKTVNRGPDCRSVEGDVAVKYWEYTGIAQELGATDSPSIRPTPNIGCFILINTETEHCQTSGISCMTSVSICSDVERDSRHDARVRIQSRVANMAGMKIAFPTRDDQTIPGHFGHMTALIVVEVVDGKETSRERRDMSDMPECGDGHEERPAFVVNVIKDCDVLIAGGIGAPLVQKANAVDVDVVLTDTHSINEALAMYLAGTLENTPELAHHHH